MYNLWIKIYHTGRPKSAINDNGLCVLNRCFIYRFSIWWLSYTRASPRSVTTQRRIFFAVRAVLQTLIFCFVFWRMVSGTKQITEQAMWNERRRKDINSCWNIHIIRCCKEYRHMRFIICCNITILKNYFVKQFTR